MAHWGQRKLLLAEIEFLSLFACPGATVLYAGAAPGNHISILLQLFPDIRRFELVDPNGFALDPDPRIRFRQEPFTDQMASEYAGVENLLFISDVRTADYTVQTPDEVEDSVWRDMADQRRWHRILRPRKSLLKFRLPWPAGSRAVYLDGLVLLPVFGPKTTTECRLVPTGGDALWDCTAHTEQLFFFNTRRRPALYPHGYDFALATGPALAAAPHSASPPPLPSVFSLDGLDHCFDCTSEVCIWMRYLLLYPDQWVRGSKKPTPTQRRGAPRPSPSGAASADGTDPVAACSPERATSPVYDPETHTFWPGGASSESLPAAQRSKCVARAREVCSTVPDPQVVGVSLADLEFEVARRVDSTSIALSTSRTLRDPDLELGASRSVTAVPLPRHERAGRGPEAPTEAPVATKRGRNELTPLDSGAQRGEEEEGGARAAGRHAGQEKRPRTAAALR